MVCLSSGSEMAPEVHDSFTSMVSGPEPIKTTLPRCGKPPSQGQRHELDQLDLASADELLPGAFTGVWSFPQAGQNSQLAMIGSGLSENTAAAAGGSGSSNSTAATGGSAGTSSSADLPNGAAGLTFAKAAELVKKGGG